MKKKVFISYSYSNRLEFSEFHKSLKRYLEENFKVEVYSFVYDFKEKVSDKEMMVEALNQLSSADILIVELSYESVGIGIEAGYAKSSGIPIIYLAKKGIDIDSTMRGISDRVVFYKVVEDVIKWISDNRGVFAD
jgi:nucleoside 2-deoxyribosyltransferase